MERALRIEAFRNIGFKDGKPWHERLVLNNSLKKGELGDLLILIGANNSGKSNVLDALKIFGNENISERDVTDLFMEEEYHNPKLILFYKGDNDKQDIYTSEKIRQKSQNSNQQSINNVLSQREAEMRRGIYPVTKRQIVRTVSPQPTEQNNSDATQNAKSLFEEEFGYKPIPKILVYKENSITNDHLKTTYHNITNNLFFTALLKSIAVEPSTIQNAYQTFEKQNNKGVLTQLRKQLNEKLKMVSQKFNQLYYLKDGGTQYSFEIDLESNAIFFSLFRGVQTISLNYQSTGFRWFFNLFFNLLNSTMLNPGDIIIMDEPATNLHVKGQRELRAFLKEFAIQNDITIVIATHSPFLIDLDYLDELRVVVNDGTVSHIVNNFAAVDPTDPDSLLPIKDSLTVENHILVNPDEKIIFVEGITDYNYLTAFKKLFGEQGITFLPINGVGENEADCQKISKELIRIRKHNPILLVDNDKAGQQMKKVNADSALTVIALNEIDESFKTIESLFSKEDLQNFGLLDESGKFIKHASTSTVFKNQILKNKDAISETTRANFRKLFDKLLHESE